MGRRRRLNKDDSGKKVTIDWGEAGQHPALLLERVDKSTWSVFCGQDRQIVKATEKQIDTSSIGEQLI